MGVGHEAQYIRSDTASLILVVPTNELEGFRRGRKRTIVVVVVAAALIATLFLLPGDETRIPDFELPLLSGGTVTSSELEGNPVILNFWKADCPPCQDEAPALERAWQTYRDDGLQMIGVNVKTTRANTEAFVNEFGITYPIARDVDSELATELGVYGLPQTFFLSSDLAIEEVEAGEEVGRQGTTVVLGAINYEELEKQIELLLDE